MIDFNYYRVLWRLWLMDDGILHITDLGLTSLPDSSLWDQVKYLNCNDNQLNTLPALPNVRQLYCNNNPLLYPPEKNNLIHLCRRSLLQLRIKAIISHWRHYVITSITRKKWDLHTELLYSPNVKGSFYLTQRLSNLW